jgi:hypothetical protein
MLGILVLMLHIIQADDGKKFALYFSRLRSAYWAVATPQTPCPCSYGRDWRSRGTLETSYLTEMVSHF